MESGVNVALRALPSPAVRPPDPKVLDTPLIFDLRKTQARTEK